jgi:hypothetical protein
MQGGYGHQGYGQQAYGGPGMGMQQDMGGMHEDAWAAQGYPVAGPNGWCTYRTKVHARMRVCLDGDEGLATPK